MFKYAGRTPALAYIKTNDGAHTYFFITVSRKSAALLRLKNTACELFTGIALKIAGSCAMHIAVLTKEYQQTADTGRAKRRDRKAESRKSDGVGAADERLQGIGRGDCESGIDL